MDVVGKYTRGFPVRERSQVRPWGRALALCGLGH